MSGKKTYHDGIPGAREVGSPVFMLAVIVARTDVGIRLERVCADLYVLWLLLHKLYKKIMIIIFLINLNLNHIVFVMGF